MLDASKIAYSKVINLDFLASIKIFEDKKNSNTFEFKVKFSNH